MSIELGEGTYNGTVKEVTNSQSKNGTPCILIVFNVKYVKRNEQWLALDKVYERTVYLYTSEKAWGFTEEKLEALGWNGDPDNHQFKPEAYGNGEGVDLWCKIEPYEGKEREKWDIAREFEIQPMAEDHKQLLAAKWRNKHPGSAQRPAVVRGTDITPPKAQAAEQQTPVELEEPWETASRRFQEKTGAMPHKAMDRLNLYCMNRDWPLLADLNDEQIKEILQKIDTGEIGMEEPDRVGGIAG